MGRPRTGSVRRRGNGWLASVPRLDDPTRRHEYPFATEEAAREWIGQALDRLAAGLEPEKPLRPADRKAATPSASHNQPSPTTPSNGSVLAHYLRQWHHEHYDLMHSASPERSDEVLKDIETHLIPWFKDLLETDPEKARARVIAFTRVMAGYPAKPGTKPLPDDATTYGKKTVTNLLWILNEGLRYAYIKGAPIRMVPGKQAIPALTYKIHALHKRGHTPRKPRLVALAAAWQIAAGLHVIHQLVLWLMRIAGLRISEAYGLTVANFIYDGRRGYLLIEALGGREFLIRDDNEQVHKTNRKQGGKTDAAYRLIALPAALSQLILLIIAAYHTDPVTGHVDGQARLVPTIQSEGGGQAGFRNALKRGAATIQGASDNPDDYVIPHDMRKAYATDIAWTPQIDALVKRRAMGHRHGSDVFDLVYTLDDRLKDQMIPAADIIDADIAASIGTLAAPTALRPQYGRDIDDARIAYADAHLESAGWQLNPNGDYITATEAARHLGMSGTATRRLMGTMIPAIKGPNGWLTTLDDVLAYRQRLAGHRYLADVAEQAGIEYHEAHRTMRRLGIDAPKDDHSRNLLLTDADADRIVGEINRIRQLKSRSMSVAEAATALRTSHAAINKWLGVGRLSPDPERDGAGWRYVTRESVEAELAWRGRRGRSTILVSDFVTLTGLDGVGINALVARGLLRRVRTGHLTPDSVVAWATGYRPDLLNHPLLSSHTAAPSGAEGT